MASPFPRMDPYLENPELWAEVHHRLIVALAELFGEIADNLAPALRPKYRVAIEKRVYSTMGEDSLLIGIPDVAVLGNSAAQQTQPTATLPVRHKMPVQIALPMPEEVQEGYLEIREVQTGRVITAIEVLSPKNKRSGEGRVAYEKKRQQVLASASHLIEIDLLHGGRAMPPLDELADKPYSILVSRAERRPQADLYLFGLREEIPIFPVPLTATDVEPQLDLQVLLSEIYERAGFDLAIDYSKPAVPALSPEDAAWSESVFQQ